MARGEGYDFVAFLCERFEFGCKVGHSWSFRTPTLVKRGDTNGIASSNDSRRGHGFVQQDESKHSIEERGDIFIVYLVLVDHVYEEKDEQSANGTYQG